MEKGTITQAAVNSCNVSYKKSIDTSTLVGILSGQSSPASWLSHLDTFFNELPLMYITGFLQENNIPLSQAKKVFFSLHPAFQGKKFKEYVENEQ